MTAPKPSKDENARKEPNFDSFFIFTEDF